MSGTSYLVDIELLVSGNPGAAIGNVGDRVEGVRNKAAGLSKELASMGSSLLGGFTGAAEAVASKLTTLGKMGLAGSVAATAYGVAGINKGLEDTRISIGAILQVAGAAGSIEQGVSMGANAMARMRKDAAALPGTFDQLIDVFRTISTSGFGAGMAEPALEKMAERSMAAGAVMGLRSDMVGREMAQLLEGRAGAHNVFGARLGLIGAKAQEFNGMDSGKRVEVLTASLGKYDDSIKAFSSSYTALTTTFESNGKKFLGDATAPLFDRIKGTLAETNEWFDKNSTLASFYADNIGYALVKAFDWGKEAFLEYGPLVLDFGERAYDKIVRIWQDAQPYVSAIGDEIKGFLKDDAAFDKIGTVLKLYIAAKAAGPAISIAGGLFSAGSSIAGLVGGAGAGVSGAGAIGAGSAVGAALEAGLASFAAAGAATTATLIAVPTAMGVALGAAAYEVRDARTKSLTVDAMGGGAYGYDDKEMASREKMIQGGIKAGSALYGLGEIPVDSVGVGFSEVGDAANTLAFTLRSLAKSGDFDAIKRINTAIDKADDVKTKTTETNAMASSYFNDNAAAITILASKSIDKSKADDKALEEKRKADAKGKGGISIARVEITVSSNAAPDQVARLVFTKLQEVKRYRTTSPHTSNFAAGR